MRKILLNTLKLERLDVLSIKDKASVVQELLTTHHLSYREITALTDIPTTTLHHWINGRSDTLRAVNINGIYRKLLSLKPDNITDWGRIELIKEVCEKLLQKRK